MAVEAGNFMSEKLTELPTCNPDVDVLEMKSIDPPDNSALYLSKFKESSWLSSKFTRIILELRPGNSRIYLKNNRTELKQL